MSEQATHRDLFCVRAAGFSVVISLFSPVIGFLVGVGAYAIGIHNYLGAGCISVFCIAITSLILGICGIFGFSRHRRKGILWEAIAGIVASSFLALASFAYWVLSLDWKG
jgi:hypothetical protein